jgi:SAM-dependent methyltransferase
MKIDPKDFYNQADYWNLPGKPGALAYKEGGQDKVHSGLGLVWEGFEYVLDAYAATPQGWRLAGPHETTVLDIGCSGGDLLHRIKRRYAPKALHGVDISAYAVERAHPEIRPHLEVGDAVDILKRAESGPVFPHDPYTLVISTDFLEHVYREDLDEVLYGLSLVGNAFLLVVSVLAPGEKEFDGVKGQDFPPEFSHFGAVGHVTMHDFAWWEQRFCDAGLMPDWESMYKFQLVRDAHEDWRNTRGWDMRMTWLLESIN